MTRDAPVLVERLRALAGDARLVFVAGLPGTGKSLVIRELTRIAAAARRAVHTLQWDVARPAVEAAPAGRRYPLVDGVTHVVIRKAAGLWVRGAIASWHAAHPEPMHLLIGEVPLVGGRFIELARRLDDAAELVLSSPATRFVVPVPSREVRTFIEAERDRRMTDPLHPREREDAPSHVLRRLWDELVAAARRLRLPEAPRLPGPVPYDPAVYEAVYRRVLARRHVTALRMTTVLRVAGTSAYDVDAPVTELAPSAHEADLAIAAVEARYPNPAVLEAEVDGWYGP